MSIPYEQLANWCVARNIPYEEVRNLQNLRAYFVVKEHKNRAQHFGKYAERLAKDYGMFSAHLSDRNGILVVLAEEVVSENVVNGLCDDIERRYNGFYKRLDNALSTEVVENKVKKSTKLSTRVSTGTLPEAHTFDDKVDNALHTISERSPMAGIATPTNLQPSDGIKSLEDAMKKMGIIPELKKAGIKWTILGPGQHAILFYTEGEGGRKTRLLEADTATLAEEGNLKEFLKQLQDIAIGEAPGHGEIELVRGKKRDSDAGAIAGHFSADQKQLEPM